MRKNMKKCSAAAALCTWPLAFALPALAAPHVVALFPANGATNVCPDTPLRIRFDSNVSVARAGKIVIHSDSGAVLDTIDLSETSHMKLMGGAVFTNRALLVSGSTVTLCPRTGVIAYSQRCFVTVEAGTFADPAGDRFEGITNTTTWTFATRAARPPAETNVLVVAADGSGDFCTVQGAVDFVPSGNRRPVRVQIRNGTYEEIVYVTNRNNLTFRGEDRVRTVIAYANNENFNYRGLKTNLYRQVFGVDSDDVAIENLTLQNLTRKGGSQAEALRIDGQRCIVRNANFYSFQDTLKLSGTVFVSNCYVEGDVDFIWGFGSCYFSNCEIKCLTRGSCVTQIRNDAGHYGDAFVDCRFTRLPGVTNCVLSRIELSRFPHSHVAYINCRMDDQFRPEGWQVTPGTNSAATVRFWEYHTTDLSGANLLDVSRRAAFSRQLTAAEAAQMREPKIVLGGWAPPLDREPDL